jgi:hypothetical protein
MVVATRKKVEILENQVALQLFTMPEELITTRKTHEYLLLWRCEALASGGHIAYFMWCNCCWYQQYYNYTIITTLLGRINGTPSMHHSQYKTTN